jgi:response regulator RpfG family c-di-GMP phosphodiesterase
VTSLFTCMLCLWYRAQKRVGARALANERLTRQLASFDAAAATALADTLEASDRTSQTDMRRFQILAASVAHATGVTESRTAKIDAEALMRDVGTIGPLERVHATHTAEPPQG